MKIALLIPYFGNFPQDYFHLFAKSAFYNPDFDFLIFSEQPPQADLPPNVKIYPLDKKAFNLLSSQKLGLEVKIEFGYKLCDLRPMFGDIFADYLQDYEFWGHCDLDLILGNLNHFITEDILNGFDIISLRKEWISGSFALYRNHPIINRFYKQSADWQTIAQRVDYLRFDECGQLKDGQKMAYSLLAKGANLLELEMETESISHVCERIKQQKINYPIRIFQQTLIKESIVTGSILRYQQGEISVYQSSESRHPVGTQFAHYHLITEKNNRYFQFPNWEKVPDVFYIDETGFYTEEELTRREQIRKQRIKQGDWRYWTQTFPKKVFKKIFKR